MFRILQTRPAAVYDGDQVQISPTEADPPMGAWELVGDLPPEAAPFNHVVRTADGRTFAVATVELEPARRYRSPRLA